MRKQARENKNFALSDQIRDQLIALGIQLERWKRRNYFLAFSFPYQVARLIPIK